MIEIPELLSLLACPICRGGLEAKERRKKDAKTAADSSFQEHKLPDGLFCPRCSIVYPVRDNIPIMLAEEAIPLADWESPDENPGIGG
jgi:uncharacterized protein YbaR (Trm112 family)